jgi:hypothetical protein
VGKTAYMVEGDFESGRPDLFYDSIKIRELFSAGFTKESQGKVKVFGSGKTSPGCLRAEPRLDFQNFRLCFIIEINRDKEPHTLFYHRNI